MKTILQCIEEANAKAGITAPVFASLKEFNSFLDSFNELDYPANVIIPFGTNGVWLNGRRNSVVPIRGWVLTKLQEDTNNYRSLAIESEYMEPMRKKAKEFLKHLINSEIVNPEVNEISDTILPEYAFLNNHLFGVSYTINLPVYESVC